MSQGRVADAAGIQYRMLNASKGAAVRGPRAQMDRQIYKAQMQATLAATPNLEIVDGAVVDVLVGPSREGGYGVVEGVQLASGETCIQGVGRRRTVHGEQSR